MKLAQYESQVHDILKSYSNKLLDRVETLENKLNTRDMALLSKTSMNERIADAYYDVALDIAQGYHDTLEPYFDIARKSTVPFNWPLFLYLKLKSITNTNVLFAEGVHFFVALQGGGKSSLAYELITQLLNKTGYSAYINANFELPQYDPISGKYFQYFQYFKLLDFFNMKVREDDPNIEVSQLKRFNRNFKTIVLDEWLTEMNHRLNKTKDYNNIFMALLTMIAHMRHQKMSRIYVLSQIDNTDIQLLSMFKFIHEVEIDLDITYADWVRTGELKKHIKGWSVWTYGVKRNRKAQSMEKVLIKKQYISKTADFDYFDTLAQASKYESLHEDKINFIKE